ncbi:hypothetical protein Tco_1002931 [Tanacetum coccineum]|uniref:Uncharacterized protein n=1 Tax=Tanacetum coccineum TaxID=301880 RepID=A0ABQ5F7N8_9ASTR
MIPASTSFPTSSCIAWFLSAACPRFFCLTGEHPSCTFRRCFAMCLGTPIISAGGTDNQEKDEKQSQNDKTGLGMEKTVKDKAKSKPESVEALGAIRTGFLGHSLRKSGLGSETTNPKKEIPSKLEDFTKTVIILTSQVAKLKTLRCLLLNVTKTLNKFAQVLDSASSKAADQSVPLAGQADTMPAEGEKNTNQATISQLF